VNKSDTFVFSSYFPCTAGDLYDWHSRPGALERLTPPWERTSVLARQGGIRPGGQVRLRMHLGPFPYRWTARHVEDHPGLMFRDIQEKGPFASWSHSHIFTDSAKGAMLEDRIEFSLPAHGLLPQRIKQQVHGILEKVFAYRHATLRDDLALHAACSRRPLRILVTGASGVLGRALLPLLTTGGHQVWTLVRRSPITGANEIFWDPEAGVIDSRALPALDGVIHLAGEYIGLHRWSEAKKQRVIGSRTGGTELLARALAAQPVPPKVFLSASAVGYYGENDARNLDEATPPGGHFTSQLCDIWEKSATPAREAGIRTVLMRIGIVLTPKGGALRQLLAASPFGFFRSFGKGDQYVSWIGLDDAVSAMLHCLAHPILQGPVNIAAPTPVTNKEMMKTVAKTLHRPLFPSLPAWLLRTLYGQMATEILLSGCHVSSAKLAASGFTFRNPDLEGLLRRQISRRPATASQKEQR
jgi:uncharacterized protein (TIGR01777 family)